MIWENPSHSAKYQIWVIGVIWKLSSFQNFYLGLLWYCYGIKSYQSSKGVKNREKHSNYVVNFLYFAVSLCVTCDRFSQIMSQMSILWFLWECFSTLFNKDIIFLGHGIINTGHAVETLSRNFNCALWNLKCPLETKVYKIIFTACHLHFCSDITSASFAFKMIQMIARAWSHA